MPSPSLRGLPRAALITASAIALATVALVAPVDGGVTSPPEARAGTVCGAGEPLRGVDVSKYQGQIDWRAVAESGIRFGIARIADGLTYPDMYFEANYAGMRANGITPGSYLFWEPAQDPVAQANVVIRALEAVRFDVGDLPPTLDVEVTGRQSAETIAARLRTTVTVIQNAIGVTPFIYTSPKFWTETLTGPDFSDLPLWVAHWRVACPSTPASWPAWSLWQTTSSGAVPGIVGPVDLDQTTGPSLPVYTGAPILSTARDMHVLGEGPTVVTYAARAVGYRGVGMQARCNPGPGTLFKLGTTTVICSAQNLFGATIRSFNVTVRPPTPPSFETPLPRDITADASGRAGTRVTWAPLTAIDHSGARIPVSCSPNPDALFPLGQSLVICRATDSFGQQIVGTFTVSVGYRFAGLLRR